MDWQHTLQILLLAIIQGAAEMLPVSSSAHVTIAARLMRFQQGSPYQWAFLLVMLHTGTMVAVLVYFRSRWKPLLHHWRPLLLATVCTGIVGYGLKTLIETVFLAGDARHDQQEIESLFNILPLIAASLAGVGILIIVAGLKDSRSPGRLGEVGTWPSLVIGAVQGLCLPFRGFSRSGATISTSYFFGIERIHAEEFSFALAVLLTPAVIGREALKMWHEHAKVVKEHAETALASQNLSDLFLPGLLGMVFSFAAGMVALYFLSRWMEKGRWQWFGVYCLAASVAVMAIHLWLPA